MKFLTTAAALVLSVSASVPAAAREAPDFGDDSSEYSGDGEYDYGDNSSTFAYDGTCDDIRFVGAHSVETLYLAEDIGHDASDCREGVEAGELTWQANAREFELGLMVDE